MPSQLLPPDQDAAAQAIFQRIRPAFLDGALALARLLAAKDNEHLRGKTEFEVRDAAHRLGARALQAALRARKKGATEAPA